MEGGEEVGFAGGDDVAFGFGGAGEAGGGGVDGVDIVPDGLGAHATKGGEDPRKEEAVAGGGAGAVFVGFFGGAALDDVGGVADGGGEVGWEEGAADGEVDGGVLLGESGGEEEIDAGVGGEGGVEVGGEGGFEGGFGGEGGGGAACEVVVAAEAVYALKINRCSSTVVTQCFPLIAVEGGEVETEAAADFFALNGRLT